METIFDWLTVAVFAGLIVLFLQRSVGDNPRDSLWQYLVPSAGCAIVNYLGNNGQEMVAAAGLVAIFAYIWYVLHPLEGWRDGD